MMFQKENSKIESLQENFPLSEKVRKRNSTNKDGDIVVKRRKKVLKTANENSVTTKDLSKKNLKNDKNPKALSKNSENLSKNNKPIMKQKVFFFIKIYFLEFEFLFFANNFK